VIGNAVHVIQIATGEIQDDPLEAGKEYARKGGPARARKLSAKKKKAIARKAALTRWAKRR